tara:strand:- start:9182 stop:9394 length:213 start_codon:yes stop_codon:yes gene_type:complete
MVKYDERHGGAFDRGAADSWYSRPVAPHYFVAATGSSDRVEEADMSAEDIIAYIAGYDWNELAGGKKSYA